MTWKGSMKCSHQRYYCLSILSYREIFQAIETNCKTKIAYGEYSDVEQPGIPPKNSLESFFLAETLKYLYLLYDNDSEIDILNEVRELFFTNEQQVKIVANQNLTLLLQLVLNISMFSIRRLIHFEYLKITK